MAFATTEDVGTRLGRDLTEAEEASASLVIELVTGLVVSVVDRDEEWAEDLDPVPSIIRALCIEKAIGAIVNPTNLAALSQQLGQAQRSETFPRSLDVGVFLTPSEESVVRRAIYGAGVSSSRVKSLADELVPCEGS